MAGVTPNEGKAEIFKAFYKKNTADRVTLLVGLMKNAAGLSVASALSDIIPITGGGYAPVTFIDANWTVVDGLAVYPPIDFMAVGTPFDDVTGYYVFTTGATPRLIHFEYSATAPNAIGIGETYSVDLSNTGA